MLGRVGALITGATLVAIAFVWFSPATSPVAASGTCPPVTFDDLTSTTTTLEVAHPTTTSNGEGPNAESPPGTTVTVEPDCAPFVYDMTFPLVVRGSFISGFGDERDDGARLHKGVDIEAPLLTAVVAVRDGTVALIHNDAGAEDCCWVALEHDDGWQSWYIHLNNDTLGTDDGQGLGVRIDLEVGAEVSQGDVIGWLGDSGNAEDTNTPHVHFELRRPDGMPVDPHASLVAAASGAASSETPSGSYPDDDGSLFEWVFELLASRGIYWPCATTAGSCADQVATPVELADLATLLTGADDAPLLEGGFGQANSTGERSAQTLRIEKLLGCPVEEGGCRMLGVSERELARLAAGIVIYRNGPQAHMTALPDATWPITLPSSRKALALLDEMGRIGECHLPLDAGDRISRGRAVYLLLSWIGDADPIPCPALEDPLAGPGQSAEV